MGSFNGFNLDPASDRAYRVQDIDLQNEFETERNPYCDFRGSKYRYTDQELVLFECDHLQDLGNNNCPLLHSFDL